MSSSKDRSLFVEGLGQVHIRFNSRAKRFIFRVKDNELVMTAPQYSSTREQLKAIDTMFNELKSLLERGAEPLIDLNYKIETTFFKLQIKQGIGKQFLAQSELGNMTIVAPEDVSFDDRDLQEWLKKVILEALRRNAKIILPPRLYMLAKRHNITYERVRINTSKGRWGSCSQKKNINLSAYLILLPENLIDYVLLHELAHIDHMDHSELFWNRLDELTNNQAERLNNELKKYKTSLFTL